LNNYKRGYLIYKGLISIKCLNLNAIQIRIIIDRDNKAIHMNFDPFILSIIIVEGTGRLAPSSSGSVAGLAWQGSGLGLSGYPREFYLI
jgi:hypothetical protein